MSRSHHEHIHISKKTQKTVIDKSVAVAAVLYPLMTIPQVVAVFQTAEGVSLGAWLGYQFFSVIFLLYGLRYKLRPVIVTQVLWVIMNSLVIGGVIYHRI